MVDVLSYVNCVVICMNCRTFASSIYLYYINGSKYFDQSSAELCHGVWHIDGGVLDFEIPACPLHLHSAAHLTVLLGADSGSTLSGLFLCPPIPQPLLRGWPHRLHAGLDVLSADVCWISCSGPL